MKYKETGIEWLGKIPEHWQPTTIKNHFYVVPSNVDKKIKDNEIPVELCNYVDVYYNDFIDLSVPFMEATANENEVKKFQLKEKDVLITKDSEDPLDIGVPALINQVKDKLLCGYHLSRLRVKSNKITGDYLFWLLKDTSIASQLWREATGVTRWAIASRHVKNSIIALPPKEEQKAITYYLNKSCNIIDKIIHIKKNQLKKINKQQTSKSFELLTRGVIRNRTLINSGINWMDKMPENWKRKRLKDVVILKSGDSITSFNIHKDEAYPVYGGNGLRGYAENYTHDGYYPLIGRQGALCGNINYAKGKFFATEHAVVAAPINKCNVYWIGELMRAMNLNQYSNSAAQPGLSVEKIKQLKIPFPDLTEQEKISIQLRELYDRNLILKKNITKQIDVLKKFKINLIHECVTGKKQIVKAMETIKN